MATIMRRRRLVAIFWAMLTAHLIFSVVSGSFSLHALFRDAPANMEKCVATEPEDPNQESACRKAEVAVKGAFVSILIIIWLVQICAFFSFCSVERDPFSGCSRIVLCTDACIVVDKYTKQLAEEEDAMFKEETGRPTW